MIQNSLTSYEIVILRLSEIFETFRIASKISFPLYQKEYSGYKMFKIWN